MAVLFLVNTAVKATAVLCLAWMTTTALRRRSAALRHLVWSSAALALLALPFLSASLPRWEIPVQAELLARSGALFSVDAAGVESRGWNSPAQRSARAGAPAHGANPVNDWFLTVWSAGALLALAPFLTGTILMWRMVRRARPLAEAQSLAGELAAGLGIRKPVRVLAAEDSTMPMTWGMRRPVILLPATAANWSVERLRIVLLHELAHVRRADCLVHALFRLASSLYWFHPLVWWAMRRAAQEREHAADDFVLGAGAAAPDYAEHLLEIARSLRAPAAVAGLAMVRRSQLRSRVSAILDSRADRASVGRAAAVAAVVLGLLAAIPLAALRPSPVPVPTLRLPLPATRIAVPAMIPAAAPQEPEIERLEKAATQAMRDHQYEAAERDYLRALEWRAERYGPQSPEYARGLARLGALYHAWRHGAQATEYYQQAASLLETTLGPNAPGLDEMLYYLAAEAHGHRQYNRALELYQRALDIRSTTAGPDDGQAGSILNRMGILKQQQNDPAAAEQFFQRALAIEEKSPHSAELASTLELYSQLLKDSGREAEARPMKDRSEQIRAARIQEKFPPSPGSTGPVQKVGGPVQAPKLLYKVEPEYTEEARAGRLAGTVRVSVEVWPDGRAHNAQIKNILGLGLDEKALEAISQWQFAPGTRDGQPVTVAATIEVNFRLQ